MQELSTSKEGQGVPGIAQLLAARAHSLPPLGQMAVAGTWIYFCL